MSTFGLISTGVALLNMKKAKAERDHLQEKKDGILSVLDSLNKNVAEYNAHKDDVNKEELPEIDEKPNDFPDGLQVTTLLRVANLVGQLFYARTSVIFRNTSDQQIYIRSVEAECKVLGVALQMFKPGIRNLSNAVKISQKVDVNRNIDPGEILEVQLPKSVSSLGDKQGELRDLICKLNGKKLITSCGKTNIEDGETADWMLWWGEDKQCYAMNRPGVLRYCMEAGLG